LLEIYLTIGYGYYIQRKNKCKHLSLAFYRYYFFVLPASHESQMIEISTTTDMKGIVTNPNVSTHSLLVHAGRSHPTSQGIETVCPIT
jgi:hypothetical protein